jgi:hypothetical protein
MGGAWTFETLDAPASKGDNTDAASYLGQLHVVSGDITVSNQANLRHGWFDGSSWSFVSLPVMCIGKQSLVVYDGLLHLFAREPNSLNLLHASWDGGSWSNFEALDVGASQGVDVSTVVQGGDFGTLHVFNAGYIPSQGNVLRHLSYSGVWQDIGHANNVVAMAAINNKLFCVTQDNRLWARDPVLFEVNWQDIGHANNVVAMAAINGKLFCATRDNRLWARDP